jgi:hypothetical protein
VQLYRPRRAQASLGIFRVSYHTPASLQPESPVESRKKSEAFMNRDLISRHHTFLVACIFVPL